MTIATANTAPAKVKMATRTQGRFIGPSSIAIHLSGGEISVMPNWYSRISLFSRLMAWPRPNMATIMANINGRVKTVANIVEYVNFIYRIFTGKCIDRDFAH